MDYLSRTGKTHLAWVIGLVLIVGVGIVLWRLTIVDHVAHGQSQKDFVIKVDYDTFRQILVRKNASQAIIAQTGMKLLSENVNSVDIDVTNDERPLLNALRGHSKAELSATKKLSVQLDDPNLNAKQLTLQQTSEVKPDAMHVRTESVAASGNLESYATTLDATPDGLGTKVSLTIDQSVRVQVPMLFVSTADKRVQQAAEAALRDQAVAIEQFVMKYADERIILPELGK